MNRVIKRLLEEEFTDPSELRVIEHFVDLAITSPQNLKKEVDEWIDSLLSEEGGGDE